MGGMEAVITGLADDFKILKKHRKIFTFATAFGTFLFALLCITNVSGPTVGVDRFSEDIERMMGFKPGLYWRLCWKFVSPTFLL
ncbi:hypothetical protein CRUP_004439, partial [Coryphaenoides rupestris]